MLNCLYCKWELVIYFHHTMTHSPCAAKRPPRNLHQASVVQW